MDFGIFAILGIVIALTGIKVVRDIWRQRRQIFDRRFTEQDRAMVSQAAFYLLLPLSVALHELGHAIAVWSFGGKVVDFGFYFFAGFVSYEARFSPSREILVAVAGPFVNVLLAGGALAVIFFRRPPMRAAVNELLFQFAVLSAVNALIFYPLLDLATGMNGDFSQMYRGGMPSLSAAIFAVHAGILLGGYVVSKNERFSRHLATLTGLPPGVQRGLLGGMRLAAGRRPAQTVVAPTLSPAEETMRQAAQRVASGWPHKLDGRLVRGRDGASMMLSWPSAGAERRLALLHREDGETLLAAPAAGGASVELRRWPAMPSADELVVSLRVAMEQIERASSPDGMATPVPAD